MNGKRRKIISVIGNKSVEGEPLRAKIAYEIGKALVDHGYRVQTGGMSGVMREALRGAKDSEKYREGDTIAILPGFDTEKANEFADIVIPTGLDIMRNAIVGNADAVIGIGGGAGTMSEYAFAWSMKRLIVAFGNTGGWSEKLAGTVIDDTYRTDCKDDKVFSATTADEAIAILEKYLGFYPNRHGGIRN